VENVIWELFRVLELCLCIGKDGETEEAGHFSKVSGGITDFSLSKRRVQGNAVFIYLESLPSKPNRQILMNNLQFH
jgi:hypothetical protein